MRILNPYFTTSLPRRSHPPAPPSPKPQPLAPQPLAPQPLAPQPLAPQLDHHIPGITSDGGGRFTMSHEALIGLEVATCGTQRSEERA